MYRYAVSSYRLYIYISDSLLFSTSITLWLRVGWFGWLVASVSHLMFVRQFETNYNQLIAYWHANDAKWFIRMKEIKWRMNKRKIVDHISLTLTHCCKSDSFFIVPSLLRKMLHEYFNLFRFVVETFNRCVELCIDTMRSDWTISSFNVNRCDCGQK